MLTRKSIDLIEKLESGPHYTRGLASIMSSRTLLKRLRKLEEAGLIEKYKKKQGRGRPRHYYRLTREGHALRDKLRIIREDLFYLLYVTDLRHRKVPVTAGITTSLASLYGAPLVLPQLDVVVPKTRHEEAQKIMSELEEKISKHEGLLGNVKDRINILPVTWKGFEKRAIKVEGIPYLDLADLIFLTVHQDEARHVSCLPRAIHGRSPAIDYDRLLDLATDRNLAGRIGAILDVTNRLAGEEIVPNSVLENFRRSTPRRKVKPSHYKHPLVKKELIPSKEDAVDAKIRERWHVTIPTFREMKEIWELSRYES